MDLVIQAVTSKYIDFSGRARRKEFWLFQLFYIIFYIIAQILDFSFGIYNVVFGMGPITVIFWLAILIPTVAVSVRRLHDTNKTGLWYLVVFIPILGWIVLLIFFVMKGTEGGNDYGEDPLAETG